MDEAELREILRLGLGRAILYAQSHDMRPFRDLILDACLHCYSLDFVCEGTRGYYMYDLVGCLPDRDFYRDEVLKALRGSGDDQDAAQRFHFAACFALDGDEEAKRAMYEHYDPAPRMGELIGCDFVQMDGMEGLLFVAGKIGALVMEKPERVDEGLLFFHSTEILGEQAVLDALQEAGAKSTCVEQYRSVAVERLERQGRPSQYRDITALS